MRMHRCPDWTMLSWLFLCWLVPPAKPAAKSSPKVAKSRAKPSTKGMPCTQCAHSAILYVGNYLKPSVGLFSPVGCSITDFFPLLVDGGCGTFELPPIFTHLAIFGAHFYLVLLHVLCYRWMLDYDDGEPLDVMYIHNATNRQVGCYTLQSGFQHSCCYLSETMSLWILFLSQHLNPPSALSDHRE